MENIRLSCYVLTRNSERRLIQVLSSIVNFVDDLVILDSGSSDRTLEIAKKFGARIFYRDFDNFSNQRNYGLSLCLHDWVFELDSDEVVSPALQKRLSSLKESGFSVEGVIPDAFGIRREWFLLGKKVHCFYPLRCPDLPLRLFQRKKIRYQADRFVHEYPIGYQTTRKIHEEILHYSCDNAEQMYAKINQYTTLAAKEMYKAGKSPSLVKVFVYPWVVWFKYYVVFGGWKDGFVGLVHGRYVRDYVWQYLVKLRFYCLNGCD